MFGLGRIGVAIGAGFFLAREVERKLIQRREQPIAFRETPLAYSAGIVTALGILALTGPSGATAMAGVDDDDFVCDQIDVNTLVCKRK